jgi:hypothetical protein
MPTQKSFTQISPSLADMEEMEDKTKGHKERLAKLGVRILPLESLPRELSKVAGVCLAKKDYDTAADACAMSRVGFSLYFNAFAPQGACPPPPAFRQGVRLGLERILRAVKTTEREMSHNGSNRNHLRDVRDFRANVEFRLHCWRLLQSTNGCARVLRAVAERAGIPLVFDKAA